MDSPEPGPGAMEAPPPPLQAQSHSAAAKKPGKKAARRGLLVFLKFIFPFKTEFGFNPFCWDRPARLSAMRQNACLILACLIVKRPRRRLQNQQLLKQDSVYFWHSRKIKKFSAFFLKMWKTFGLRQAPPPGSKAPAAASYWSFFGNA